MSASFLMTAAHSTELPVVFQRFFEHLPREERERRVTAALELIRNGELDPVGIRVIRAEESLLGVLICQPAAGASALMWPPVVMDCVSKPHLEDELVRQASAWLQRGGAKLAQALLTEEELARAGALERNGFHHVTQLWYLRHDLKNLPSTQSSLVYHSYPSCDRHLFQETLLRTYEGTLDCPEINHVRTVEEILAGHQSQGRHDARRWWLTCDHAGPVGVLLLADVPALGGWDLSYLGVVPSARRRGVGFALTCKALHEAHASGTPQLSLAVDGRNAPAWALYRGLGFEPFDSRELLLAIWVQQPCPS